MSATHVAPLRAAKKKETLIERMDRFFPAPQFLAPRTCGIDISDASIKWMTLTRAPALMRRVETWGEIPLAPGVVEGGVIRNVPDLASALSQVVPHMGGARAAHAALPEEPAYVFGMQVPVSAPREQIFSMIEFEFNGRVPIAPPSAVYDYSLIDSSDGAEGAEVGVVVFPREQAAAYAAAFDAAGIELLSLELEARSIARAVCADDREKSITLLVDFGRTRTGIAVVKNGVPIFTSTVDIGGGALSEAIQTTLSLSPEAAEDYCNEQGLLPDTASPVTEILSGVASSLADEVARHFRYWDSRRNDKGERVTPVGDIVLVGGSANLHGLPDFIANRVQAPVAYGNVWRNVAEFSEYIPPIDERVSLQFATTVGLALRGL